MSDTPSKPASVAGWPPVADDLPVVNDPNYCIEDAERECGQCHRVGQRGFVPSDDYGWVCAAERSCLRRWGARLGPGRGYYATGYSGGERGRG